MGSSIKINSISIDLAGAANESDMVKCDHFSIRGFVAETRERDQRKCWPFSEKSISLVDKQIYSLPSLSVPKFKWWRCMSCIRDVDADGTKDSGERKLDGNSTTTGERKLDGNSSVLNSLTVIDQEKEKITDIAVPGNAVEENEDVNCERSQKDDQTATASLINEVHTRSMAASTVRSKSRKLRPKLKVKKSSDVLVISSRKEKQKVDQAVTTFGSSEIAGVVEDTPPKAYNNHRVLVECDNVSSDSIYFDMSGSQRRKPRKSRPLSDFFGKDGTETSGNIRKQESSSKRESVRGRKRKTLPETNYVSRVLSTNGATCENASKSCDSDDQGGDSESTDSGFERDPIKGKQKNRRFQVVDEFLPTLPCEASQEGIRENAAAGPSKSDLSTPVPCPPSTKKKDKAIIDKRKSAQISFSSGMDEGNQVKPRTGPSMNAVSQSTGDLLNEKRVGSLFDDRLASEGYVRKSIPQLYDKPVLNLHMQGSDHARSRNGEVIRDIASSSKSNTGGWLRTGVDVVDFRSNNNNTDRSSFPNFNNNEIADRSCVLQKDASGADRKGKTIMVQEQHGASRSQSHYGNENTLEEQNDDIPMEIVELMAKNQYERCLPDKEEDLINKLPSQETTHKSKNALLIDLNETYDNGISPEDNNNNTSRKEEHFPSGKQQNFFPISQPYVPSSFGNFPPTQGIRASSLRFSGHSSQWIGNVPAMAHTVASPSSYQVLRSGPHQYREAASHPIWPSSMIPPQQGRHNPVSFNMDQSTKLNMLLQASSNENAWNLNFVAANGKQKCGPNPEFSFGCKHAAAGVNSSRSMDAFSTEPVLNLLSLMDPRLRTNAAADHHGNTKFTKRHFPPVNQSKERIEIQTGDCSKTAYPTRQLPFDLYSKRLTPEIARTTFPPLGTSSFSFQNAQASWMSHHQENRSKRNDTVAPVFPSSNEQGKFQLLGASNSMMLPLRSHMTDKEKKQKRKAESCSNASALPLESSSGPMVCSVNRNPADFTIAEPGNVYMLTGENFKIRKRAAYKKRTSLCKKKQVGPDTDNA